MNRAHPRAYGENTSFAFCLTSITGSSPCIRGKLGAYGEELGFIGLIPVHTGKTGDGRTEQLNGGAHPRAYGENAERTAERIIFMGSSPCIRGKLPFCRETSNTTGLIPVHTGKTWVRGIG